MGRAASPHPDASPIASAPLTCLDATGEMNLQFCCPTLHCMKPRNWRIVFETTWASQRLTVHERDRKAEGKRRKAESAGEWRRTALRDARLPAEPWDATLRLGCGW